MLSLGVPDEYEGRGCHLRSAKRRLLVLVMRGCHSGKNLLGTFRDAGLLLIIDTYKYRYIFWRSSQWIANIQGYLDKISP